MFGDIALQCLDMLGVGSTIPGGILAKDIPSSLRSLQKEVREMPKPSMSDPPSVDDNSPEAMERSMEMETRVWPLVDLMERACAADVAVTWERV